MNETWLLKHHNDIEIFPNNTYKVFRCDRSPKTHPPDKDNPNKFKTKGGGILIAVRADLDVKSTKLKLACMPKAEIISIKLKFDNGKKICITTCYRVGTLGDPNYREIDKYLRSVALKRIINTL